MSARGVSYLVIGFCVPPFPCGNDLGGNLPVLPPLLLHFLCDILRDPLLLFIMEEDGATILGSYIWALPVGSCGIVHLVEELDELTVGNFLGIEDDLECFGI